MIRIELTHQLVANASLIRKLARQTNVEIILQRRVVSCFSIEGVEGVPAVEVYRADCEYVIDRKARADYGDASVRAFRACSF